MKRNIVISLVVLGVIFLTWTCMTKNNSKVESVYTKISKLNQFNIDQVKGSYFILHFWAKWCEPCADEIPLIVEFAKHASFSKPFKILAVSLDPSLEESKKILPNQGVGLPSNFILALDSEHKVADDLGSYQYPETYLIDPEGRILEKWIGAQKWNNPEVLEYFKQKIK